MTGWDENGDGIDEYSGGSGIDYLAVTVVDKESQPPGNGGGVGQPGFSLQGPTAVTYGPVSYTHLDVYKRQPVAYAAGPGTGGRQEGPDRPPPECGYGAGRNKIPLS